MFNNSTGSPNTNKNMTYGVGNPGLGIGIEIKVWRD
jgi:hypothetical protein